MPTIAAFTILLLVFTFLNIIIIEVAYDHSFYATIVMDLALFVAPGWLVLFLQRGVLVSYYLQACIALAFLCGIWFALIGVAALYVYRHKIMEILQEQMSDV